jgi:hypothetical protein
MLAIAFGPSVLRFKPLGLSCAASDYSGFGVISLSALTVYVADDEEFFCDCEWELEW